MSNSSYNFLTQRLSFFLRFSFFLSKKAIGRFIYILQITFYIFLFFPFLAPGLGCCVEEGLVSGVLFCVYLFSLSIFCVQV